MARPKSDDKRKAILDAAIGLFASRGIAGTPTSAISRAAGIAEGSLFTYFKTKDELINELYKDLRAEFGRRLVDYPHGAGLQDRLRYMWNEFLKLGREHPERLRVLTQLRTSGKLLREDETPGLVLVELLTVARQATQGDELQALPADYLVIMLRAQLEITVEFINANPEHAALCGDLGFHMLWRGLTGEKARSFKDEVVAAHTLKPEKLRGTPNRNA